MNDEQLHRNWYFNLSVFLSKCDNNFISGMVLWSYWDYESAGNLFWLSLEQLIKLINIQNDVVEKKYLTNNDIDELYNNLNDSNLYTLKISKIFREVDSKHSLNSLIKNSNQDIKYILEADKWVLEKLKKLYSRRYYSSQEKVFEIPGRLVDQIEIIYYRLRCFIDEKIPASLIDEIFLKVEFNKEIKIPLYKKYLTLVKNFSKRKFPSQNCWLNYQLYSYDGITRTLIKLDNS